MQNLACTYFQERQWAKLETAARFLLTFEPEPEAAQTRRWLAEALLEGQLRPDQRLFERVFDEGAAYPALNEYLATVYLEQKNGMKKNCTGWRLCLSVRSQPVFRRRRCRNYEKNTHWPAWLVDLNQIPCAAW